MYCGLQAIVTSPNWVSQPIQLQTGVYQGDPFSVVVFNTVMSTMADSLKSMHNLGYKFSGSQRAIHLLQYADDTCLVGDGPASCQRLLKGVERWLDWSKMKAKVQKCHCLALHASTAKVYDPKLYFDDQLIHFIGIESIKFLGVNIQVPSDPKINKERLSNKLTSMLEQVDNAPVTCHQKLLLYRAAICPTLNWDFTINQFPISWVKSNLEATATRFLKRWVGLARSADPSRLYIPKGEGGLDLPAISVVYKKQQASTASLLVTSSDPIVQHTTKVTIRKEQKIRRPSYRPMIEVRKIWQDDPGASKKSLIKKAKAQVRVDDVDKRLEHAKSLRHQGQLMRVTASKASSIWSSAILHSPSQILKFALNAAQNTLPHNANLSLWKSRDGLSDACKLCGIRQTLAHVLNQCPIALQLRHYNTRHDAVLEVIERGIQPFLSDTDSLVADLNSHHPYIFPPNISHTDLCPDLVV